MASLSSAGFAGVRRSMVFIDGQYVRRGLIDGFGDNALNYEMLVDELRRATSYGALYPQLIRAYYYDAVPDLNEPERLRNQKAYLERIKSIDYFELRLGRAKKSGRERLKQKGVDTLIAIDMLSKAYENHYDVAVLVSGDEDFLDLVKAVKNTGKQVFGAFFERSISSDLKDSFDKKFDLEKIITSIRSKR
jgi:uncharacterized LabA/DUF88 family protein